MQIDFDRLELRAAAILVALAMVLIGLTYGVAAEPANANAPGTTFYSPSSSNEVLAYNRIIRRQHAGSSNGTLIGTFEHATLNGAAAQFQIRKSTDDGATWSTISTLSDPLTGAGHPADHMWEPYLFEFPSTIGGFPAGTLVLAADMQNASSTTLVDWRSSDGGVTWTFLSGFQAGGTPGAGIWEPFLALDSSGNLNCYFSDERQNGTYSQKLAHIVSTDGGATWSANSNGSTRVAPGEVNDVASTTQSDRPGMATIAVTKSGLYVMSYEICGSGRGCEAFIKTSTTGNVWGSGPTDLGTFVQTADGRYLQHSPFLAFSPSGGPNGELLLTAQNESGPENQQVIFVNTNNGTGAWSWIPAPFAAVGSPSSNCNVNYSPDLLVSADGESVRYTAPSATGAFGCQEQTGQSIVGSLPFNSTFGGGDSGWVDYGGCWSTSSAVYSETCGGSGGQKAVAGSTGWGDYTLQGDVRIDSGTQAGLIVRVSNPSSGTDAFNGYYANVTATNIDFSRENGGWTPLASIAIPGGLSVGSWYHLSVQATGCTFVVSGTPVGSTAAPVSFSFTDAGCAFTRGAVGVRDQSSTASFRNLTVASGGTTSTAVAPYLAPFASGSSAGWSTFGGTWAANATSRTYTDSAGGAGDKAVAGSSSWNNYTLAGDVEMLTATGGSPNAGLTARVTSPAVGADALNGYYAGLDGTSLILGKETYGWSVLGAVALPVAVSTGTWYHITLEVSGCDITATGQPSAGGSQVSVTYHDAGCTITSGQIGTRTFNTTAAWRDITVTPR